MREAGQPLHAVIRQPFHTTLWIWAHAIGKDRRDSLIRQGERIDAASSQAIAFHDPKKIGDLVRAHQDALGMLPTVEETMKRGEALITAMNRIAERLDTAERSE